MRRWAWSADLTCPREKPARRMLPSGGWRAALRGSRGVMNPQRLPPFRHGFLSPGSLPELVSIGSVTMVTARVE